MSSGSSRVPDFGEQVANDVVMPFVLEEGLIRADDLGIFLQASAHPGAQADEALDTLGRQEGVAEDLFRLLADAVHAAGALNEADDGPRQVIVHDDGRILEVLAFTQHVGGDENPDLGRRGDEERGVRIACLVALRTEPADVGSWVIGVAGHIGEPLDPRLLQLVGEVQHGVRKLREDEDLLIGVFLGEELLEFGELVVAVRLPQAGEFKDGEQALGVLTEVARKLLDEQVRTEPVEKPRVLPLEKLVAHRRIGSEGGKRVGVSIGSGGRPALLVLEQPPCRLSVVVGVVPTCVEQRGVLGTHGQWQAVLQRVEADEVAQDVPPNGEQKGVAAAFEAFEQVRTTEADEALARTGQVVHHVRLFRGRRVVGRGLEIVGQAVARKMEQPDGVNDGI